MSKKGIVFDIQRCSLHDGPGIRTTVFLKGCPMKCIWCHNPESVSFQPEISYNLEKCVHCLACAAICPTGAHKACKQKHVMDHALCKMCGKCVQECPSDALKKIGEECGTDSVLQEVERDIEYYRRSEGGVTLSGGEPMAQFDFLLELLQACKERGIHTCIETCGYAPRERYERILPVVDLFLFDYKATNPNEHKKFTGVTNELIISNLDFLYASKAQIILRCPLIPGINDSHEHLKGIAVISRNYPDILGVEIMAYHDLGREKNRNIGKAAGLTGIKTASEETKSSWLKNLYDLGCLKCSIG